MPIANEYEALTPEASSVVDDFRTIFKVYIKEGAHPLTIRELSYLAHQGIDSIASEMVLMNAIAKRKQERQEKNNA